MRVYASAEMTLTDTNDGISVTGIDRYYMASSSSSGITVGSQGWKPDPQETNPVSRYHWSYEVVNYSDGAKIPSKPAVIGVYGKDGKEGIDAVTVSLSSEAHTFAGTESRAIASSITIDISAFKGSQRIPTSIGTVTGGISGQLTHSELGRGTTNNKLVINATSALAKANGTLSIPIVADGRTFNKVFSWSVAFKGIPGKNGTDGTTTYTWIRYADTPTSGMSNSALDKQYIGLSFNQTTQTESSNYNDYQWSLMPQNIEIGGRNYLINTDGEYINDNSTNVIKLWDIADVEELRGQVVTLSFELKSSNASNKFYASVSKSSPSTLLAVTREDTSPTEYKKYEYTFTFPTDETSSAMMIVSRIGNYPNNTGLTTFRKLKLERGNVATDWTPAPEDVEAAYTAVAQAKAEAERIKAEAYADGKITDEEEARIAQAEQVLKDAKAHVLESIQNIEIGGRNLALGTSDTSKAFDFPQNGTEYRIADSHLEDLLNGGKYTASVFIDELSVAPTGLTIMLSIRNANGSAFRQMNSDETFYVGDTGILSSTFDVNEIVDRKGKYATIHLRVNSSQGAKGVYRNLKLERGNVATDWTPAPEDVEAAYTAVAQAKAEAERVKAESYADGKVTAEEKKRIAEAEQVLKDAKAHALKSIQDIRIGGRNLLNDTSSEWEELTLDTGQTLTYVHPEAELKQDSTYTFTVEYETNDAIIDVQVGTGLLGYEQDIVGWNTTSIPSNQRVSLTHRVLESELIKGTNTDSISIDDNFYLDSAMIVTNQSNPLYSASGMINPPIGGVFNNIQRDGIIPANRRKIDFPPLHNTIIVLLDYYNMTKDMRYLDKAKLIANYILTLEFQANFAGQRITLVAGNNVWNGTTWVLGKSEIGLRIVYNALNVMTLMYEHTKDERYATLAKKLMITTTTAYGNVVNRISWGELGNYMSGAAYDQIYVNPDNENASFSWAKFNPNNADALVEAYHNYIRVFRDTEVTTVENNKIKPSVVVDGFAKWIIAINDRGELTMSPTGLPYIFYDYPAGGVNWDWVSGNNERGDVWFTGDASLWIIKGLSLLANDYPQLNQLAGTYFNNLYKLKATTHPTRGNLASQVLFYDRYNFDGSRLADDMALSISSTALFWEVGQNLNLITPKLEQDLINTLNVNYPERTGNKNVDGAYSWDAVYPQDSLIEVKANGEIYHTLLTCYFAKSGSRNIFAYKITNRGTKSTIRYRRQQLEHGNIPTDWTESPEDTQTKINDKASAEDLTNASNDLNTTIGDLSNTVDGKVDKSMYEEFLEHNADIQQQLSTSTANAQEDISKALARTATVEQKLGEGAADWIFTHTQIRMSDEGITLGEEGSGSYLQITNDQISFYNGSAEPVAFINGGMLNINHAIFVESIQISEFMFSSEAPGHLTLRYVGN